MNIDLTSLQSRDGARRVFTGPEGYHLVADFLHERPMQAGAEADAKP